MTLIYKLFFSFAKIGLLGFGGGLAILPLIYQSVQTFSDMSSDEFANLFAISQATPGPMAVNAATFVGFKIAGVAGAAAATLGVAMPSFVLVTLVASVLEKNEESPLVKGAFAGIRPATVGMIGAAVVFMAGTAFFTEDVSLASGLMSVIEKIDIVPTIMAVATLILSMKTKLGTIKLILIMGVLGVIFCS